MTTKYKFLVLAMSLFTMTSCYDDFNQLPNSSYTSDNYFNNLKECEAAVNGVYNGLTQPNGPFGQYFVQIATHGTHTATNVSNQEPQKRYAEYTFDNAEEGLERQWINYYGLIFSANQVINRIAHGFSFDEGSANYKLQHRLIAEAKFLRALSYFYLVRYWGDVPFVTEELTDFKNINRPRTDSKVIYDTIQADLQYAEQYLYHTHWSNSEPKYLPEDMGRATVAAAKGLLAKVYLTRASYPLRQTEYYQKAYDKAKELLANSDYELDPDYSNLCTVEGENSHEWLFQVQFNYSLELGGVWGGVQNPTKAKGARDPINDGFGRTNPTLSLIQKYDHRDPRFINNIATGQIDKNDQIVFSPKQVNWFCFKFKHKVNPVAPFKTDINAPVLRLADVYLILAEAAANLQGKEHDAYDAVDAIRGRARSGGEYPANIDRSLIGEDLINEIFWERARELCFEGDDRCDLIRFGNEFFLNELQHQKVPLKFIAVSGGGEVQFIADKPTSPTWLDNFNKRIDKERTTFSLLPLPESEMSTNPAVADAQNPGYN